MSGFERIGVDYQYNARNINEAIKSFNNSCNRCCTQGRHIECDRCAIATAHNTVSEYFRIKIGA